MKIVRFIPNGKSVIMEVDGVVMTTDVPVFRSPMLDMRGCELFLTYALPFEEFSFPELTPVEVALVKCQFDYMSNPHHVRERIALAYRAA